VKTTRPFELGTSDESVVAMVMSRSLLLPGGRRGERREEKRKERREEKRKERRRGGRRREEVLCIFHSLVLHTSAYTLLGRHRGQDTVHRYVDRSGLVFWG